jgi:ABC-type transport system involved in cytochrome bd biosynthesis fused ATPase/permease subunit
MKIPWSMIAGWYHAVLLAALPWCAWWDPRWAPLMVVAIALVHLWVRRSTASEPWSSVYVTIPVVTYLIVTAGWSGPVWFWLAMAAVVAAAAMFLPREDGGRPDAADCLALVCWAAPFATNPAFLEVEGGGWIAPAVLLLTARRLGTVLTHDAATRFTLGPPTREVRGTLSLRGVVATSAGLPETTPLELDLRAGESLAVLCRDRVAGQALADVLAGRSKPHVGEFFIDGGPVGSDDRLVALIGPGEPMVAGSLDDNLAALRDDPPDRAALGAARDACGLAEVVAALKGRSMAADGEPLSIYHRLLVLSARVLVSHYRLIVAVDPEPWVDSRRGDLWRAALVRASVGRTSIWITGDPELADRADYVHELVDGSLRSS